MTSLKSKQKKYIVFGLVLMATASALAVKLRQKPTIAQKLNESLAPHDSDHSSVPSANPVPAPAMSSQPLMDDEPVDAGQTSEDALIDLGQRIESSLADQDMEAAVAFIAQRSLIQITTAARQDGSIQGVEFQRRHLQDMESYAKIHPQLQDSYDYRLTLLTAAFAGESLPSLEARVASIKTQFPQLIDRDNDCISYLLALRRNDPDPSSWKSLCETGTSEYSTYSKGMAETIRKYWQ